MDTEKMQETQGSASTLEVKGSFQQKHPYLWRFFRVWYSRLLRAFARGSGTPHQIALGATIGVFISFTPTVGLQMLLGVIIASILHANRVAAALPAWITNPVTIVPVFTFNYWLGTQLVSGPDVAQLEAGLHTAMQAARDAEGFWNGLWAAFEQIMHLGAEILVPLWLGCCLVGGVCATITYPLMKLLVIRFRDRVHRKREALHDRVIKRLEENKANNI